MALDGTLQVFNVANLTIGGAAGAARVSIAGAPETRNVGRAGIGTGICAQLKREWSRAGRRRHCGECRIDARRHAKSKCRTLGSGRDNYTIVPRGHFAADRDREITGA